MTIERAIQILSICGQINLFGRVWYDFLLSCAEENVTSKWVEKFEGRNKQIDIYPLSLIGECLREIENELLNIYEGEVV